MKYHVVTIKLKFEFFLSKHTFVMLGTKRPAASLISDCKQLLPGESCKILNNTFSTEHLRATDSELMRQLPT